MRDPSITMVREAIDHYDDNEIMNWNIILDNRLRGGRESNREILIISKQEKVDLEAFLLTPTGYDIYTNEMWSDPFDELGNLMLLLIIISKAEYVLTTDGIQIGYYGDICVMEFESRSYQISIYDAADIAIDQFVMNQDTSLNIVEMTEGPCFIEFTNQSNPAISSGNLIKVDSLNRQTILEDKPKSEL